MAQWEGQVRFTLVWTHGRATPVAIHALSFDPSSIISIVAGPTTGVLQMARTSGHGNPKWNRDETILALDLYFDCEGAIPSHLDQRIVELSNFLRRLPYHGMRRPSEMVPGTTNYLQSNDLCPSAVWPHEEPG